VYETVQNGRRYRVHERNYAVFPFASGVLKLDGAHATGRIAVTGAQSPDGRKAIRIDAPQQTLSVLPAPLDSGTWLPAQELRLSETWEAQSAGAQQRTIRIEATGIDAAALPELTFSASGITVRALPARLENRFAGERNIGVREQSFIVMRSGAGNAIAPGVQVQWWQTGANTLMTASLPAKPLPGGEPPPTPAPETAAVASSLVSAWLVTGGVLLGATTFLLCAFLWQRRAAWQLLQACRRGDARAVRDGLLAWSATMWPASPPRTLVALAERLPDPAARRALAGFERGMYGPESQKPDAAALCSMVRLAKQAARGMAGMMVCAPRKNSVSIIKRLPRKRN
jgi:hypothetical protein